MAITIRITNRMVGTSLLYEKEDKHGAVLTVPAYALEILNDKEVQYETAVTRDVWGGEGEEKYDTNFECPPNKEGEPYQGYVLTHGRKGFRIGLCEPSLFEKGHRHALRGVGCAIRKYIQIHVGPGKSEGCFLLVGGRAQEDFENSMQQLLAIDGGDTPIYVTVMSRY